MWSSQFITILHGGGGGLPNLLQYYNRGGGVHQDPKFVLRNKWTAPNGFYTRKKSFSSNFINNLNSLNSVNSEEAVYSAVLYPSPVVFFTLWDRVDATRQNLVFYLEIHLC